MQEPWVHLIVQGKGGIGKSLTASWLAQYLQAKGRKLRGIDTDPINPTFAGYAGLPVVHVRFTDAAMNVDKRQFDAFMDILIEHDGDMVVDNGASSFLAVMHYMIENNVVAELESAGKKVMIHSPIIGGQGMKETLNALETILECLPANVVVWENEWLGPIQSDGKVFTEFDSYIEHKDRIKGVVKIAQRSADTFGYDINLMTTEKLTFEQVKTSDKFRYMAKQRMNTVQRDIGAQLDEVLGL